MYDADHETRRKQQLERLYSRTPQQVSIFVLFVCKLRAIIGYFLDRRRANVITRVT